MSHDQPRIRIRFTSFVCPIRIILDRASSGLDPVLKQMDLTQPVYRTSTCVLGDPVRSEQKPSLTNILNNIQTLRRLCYRPRPGQGRRTRGPSVEENQPFCGLSAGGAGEFMFVSLISS